jgi:hypothetical protein
MKDLNKKLIEVALPLPEINDASAYDKMPGIGAHPKGIHHWWARLPLPVSRAVLFASVVDDPSSHAEKFATEEAQERERERLFGIVRKLMEKQLHKRPEIYAEARAEMLKYCLGKLPPMLDPFAGGGSIPLEAARLGMEAYAGDLNPVAVLLCRCYLELVPRWGDRPPVNPEDRKKIGGKQGWRGGGARSRGRRPLLRAGDPRARAEEDRAPLPAGEGDERAGRGAAGSENLRGEGTPGHRLDLGPDGAEPQPRGPRSARAAHEHLLAVEQEGERGLAGAGGGPGGGHLAVPRAHWLPARP